MKVSQAGIELIAEFEGFRLIPYQDIALVWTIGFGHTGPIKHYLTVAEAVAALGEGFAITETEAKTLLHQDVDKAAYRVAELVSICVTQAMFDALVSLTFNIGIGAFERSTALRRLNMGDYAGCAEAMLWWNRARVGGGPPVVNRGLARRRGREVQHFLSQGIPGIGGPENHEDVTVEYPGACAV